MLQPDFFKERFYEKTRNSAIYKKINNILYYDWNPIGCDDLPLDEYESYVIIFLRLIKKNADRKTIANRLQEIEKGIVGEKGDFEKCLFVADKILSN